MIWHFRSVRNLQAKLKSQQQAQAQREEVKPIINQIIYNKLINNFLNIHTFKKFNFMMKLINLMNENNFMKLDNFNVHTFSAKAVVQSSLLLV